MNILALDTSMGVCGAAVLLASGDAQRTVLCEESMARGHAEALMPMVAEAVAGAGIGFAEIDLIAATLGPGTFTGVRIAIAAARGFALVTKAKLWGTDSLTVMARAALTSGATPGGKPFVVAVDARGEMLYGGLYDGEGRKLDGPRLIGADEAVALPPDDLAIAVGSGAVHLAEAAHRHGRQVDAICPDLQPSAASLAELALEANETLTILRPLYLRPPDAKPQLSMAVARR
jgi:tRNA threonylcarbamoyladenosine biosynthesis protein TsaB